MTNKSPGPDGLHPRVLKELIGKIEVALLNICNKSLDEAKLPEDWKKGNITPIFKKGDKHQPKNYRPVSLTSIACKLMETFIRDQLVNHMKTNNLLSEHQHGFLSGRSTITQLLEVLEVWTDILEKGGCIDAIYLDFMMAFDTVPHIRLLTKLDNYGVRGLALDWIRSFLQDRKQRVIVNGHASPWTDVTSGIPQGSVLGPILFVVFINDLPDVVSCGIKLFADDSKASKQVKTLEDCQSLQQDLTNLQDWADKWQMRFHPQKCKVLRVGKGHPDAEYTMTVKSTGIVHTLDRSTLEVDLGVSVDSLLEFSEHIQKAAAKGNRLLGMTRRTLTFIDADVMMFIYKGLIRPIMEYGQAIWYPKSRKDIDALEAVQRRATKLIPQLKNLEYEDRLKHLKLPTLLYRRMRGDMIHTWKFMHGRYNTDRTNLFQDAIHQGTRGHSLKLYQKGPSKGRRGLDVRRKFFSQRVVSWWNSLPAYVAESETMNKFKNNLDNHWADAEFRYNPKFDEWQANPSRIQQQS